jgi:hypothetical protein
LLILLKSPKTLRAIEGKIEKELYNLKGSLIQARYHAHRFNVITAGCHKNLIANMIL